MKKRIVALGFFDGVHIGHGALLKRTSELARETGAAASVMTYSAHPSEVVGTHKVKLINTTYERRILISGLYGIDDIIIKDFTKEYAALSCEEFFDRIILDELSAAHVVAGFDFRFGCGGVGDAEALRRLSNENNIGCDIIKEVTLDGISVSSSHIRELIAAGDVRAAAKFLGHRHCIISEVSHGAKLGAGMGFPTINQALAENISLPKFGVYVSLVTVRDKVFRGVTNIGVRPTVAKNEAPRAETNIIGFSGDLYGETVKVELCEFVREEQHFASLEELAARISLDVLAAKAAKVDCF